MKVRDTNKLENEDLLSSIQVMFLGSGDAFSSGGRLHTSILVSTEMMKFLIDFGASGMVSLRRFGIDPNEIQMIFISHLHGDHFGGIPFFILDAQLISKRIAPLTIIGPPGTKKRVLAAMEVMFPGSSTTTRKFQLNMMEFDLAASYEHMGLRVTPQVVLHPSGAPALALRIEVNGKVITYTGDTEWVNTLIPAAREADLLISECYFYDKKVKFHMDYQTLQSHLHEIRPKRLVVTHMSREMLNMVEKLDCEYAKDGLILEV